MNGPSGQGEKRGGALSRRGSLQTGGKIITNGAFHSVGSTDSALLSVEGAGFWDRGKRKRGQSHDLLETGGVRCWLRAPSSVLIRVRRTCQRSTLSRWLSTKGGRKIFPGKGGGPGVAVCHESGGGGTRYLFKTLHSSGAHKLELRQMVGRIARPGGGLTRASEEKGKGRAGGTSSNPNRKIRERDARRRGEKRNTVLFYLRGKETP